MHKVHDLPFILQVTVSIFVGLMTFSKFAKCETILSLTEKCHIHLDLLHSLIYYLDYLIRNFNHDNINLYIMKANN